MLSFASCQSKKALEFKNTILQQERIAFNILVGKGGPHEERLKFLIKRDFKNALISIDKEEQAFDSILNNLKALSAQEFKNGKELKASAISYYSTLKTLQISREREQIEQEQITYGKDPDKIQAAQDSMLQLSRDKLKLHTELNEKEEALYKAIENFNTANGL